MDERRPTAREFPDSPSVPRDPRQEEFARPDADEFDGGRGGVAPEFPGDARPAPGGLSEPDVPSPLDDPGAAAVDDHVAGDPLAIAQQPVGNLDRGVERVHLSSPNQGFRAGG